MYMNMRDELIRALTAITAAEMYHNPEQVDPTSADHEASVSLLRDIGLKCYTLAYKLGEADVAEEIYPYKDFADFDEMETD